MSITTQQRGIDPSLFTSQAMAQALHAYMECSDAIQAVIREMTAIYYNPESDEDDRMMALGTIAEALFPPNYGGRPGFELDEADRHDPEVKAANAAIDARSASFAERVRAAMEAKGMTQVALAEAASISQAAVSNLLARKTHPQRRTVAKFAAALGVEPGELWPA